MTSGEEIQTWFDAVQCYDGGMINEAIDKFESMSLTAKINFNIGCCHLSKGDVLAAEEKFQAAVRVDNHLAIAFFMLGIVSYAKKDYGKADDYFKKTYALLRGNQFVDYKQLGFKYQLFASEVLHNQAAACYHLGQLDNAKELLLKAIGVQTDRKGDFTVDALSQLQHGRSFEPYVPPRSEIFRPPKAAVHNLKKKDYLGQAKVIATSNEEDVYACFSGLKKLESNPRDAMLEDLRKPERVASLRPAVVARPRKAPPDLGMLIDNSVPQKKLPPSPKSHLESRNSNSVGFALLAQDRTQSRTPRDLPPRKPLPSFDEAVVCSAISGLELTTCRSPAPASEVENGSRLKCSGIIQAGLSESVEEPPRGKRTTARTVSAVAPSKSRLASSSTEASRPRKVGSADERRSEPPPRPPSAHLGGKFTTDCGNPKNLSGVPAFPSGAVGKASRDADDNNNRASGTSADGTGHSFPRRSDMARDMEEASKKNLRESSSGRKFVADSESLPAENKVAHKVHSHNIQKNGLIQENQIESLMEIDVQFAFVKKVKIPVGASMDRIMKVIVNEAVPTEMELWYHDDLGRQQRLSGTSLQELLNGGLSQPKKLFCFPR